MKKPIEKYQPENIETKWQKKWASDNLYKSDLTKDNKYYVLAEFAYPSGDLHMGHWFTFSGADVFARFKRMQNFQVFFPNGFDAFGLPAENAAIKRNIHPKDWTISNIERMKEQYASMGASFTFDHEVVTCDPTYYKWNQWIFIKLFEKGLAYRGTYLSNWCPNCQTVLANEGVTEGLCWRCGTQVVQKEVNQWFFKITDYAEKLLWDENPTVDWPKSVRDAQNAWIGKSTGAAIYFDVSSHPELDSGSSRNGNGMPKQVRHDNRIKVFTTRPDTLYGATFLVLAPEHSFVASLLKIKNQSFDKAQDKNAKIKNEIDDYIKTARKKSEIERKEMKEKTGVFTGAYAINPLSGEKMQIWVADYALINYGTGALFGDAHDERDVEFAKKYAIPLKPTVITGDKEKDKRILNLEEVFLGYGTLVDSGEFSGLTSKEATVKVIAKLIQMDKGEAYTVYHLHDWSISRQRYWGTPVPMIHCPTCGIVPVPEKDLPVELPYEVDYTPKGKPPLASNEEWVHVECPKCGGKAQRDAETLDTFVDSAWYFFRYLDPQNKAEIFGSSVEKRLMPVDIYFGGAEHTLGHTLYSRFFTKFFKDLGITNQDEYAKKRVNHGVILGPDGYRMSKSKGNVVNPDDEVKKYGADTIRVFLAFFMPYDATGSWVSDRVWGAHRFLLRVWSLYDKISYRHPELDSGSNPDRTEMPKQAIYPENSKDEIALSSVRHDISSEDLYQMHKTIKKVTDDIEGIRFNTAVAALMEWLNHLYQKSNIKDQNVTREEYETFLLLLAPFAPHMTEELWEKVAQVDKVEKVEKSTSPTSSTFPTSIHKHSWPVSDNSYLKKDQVDIAVQINGRVRAVLSFRASDGDNQEVVEKAVLADDRVKTHTNGKKIRKTIFIKGKIINLVVS